MFNKTKENQFYIKIILVLLLLFHILCYSKEDLGNPISSKKKTEIIKPVLNLIPCEYN